MHILTMRLRHPAYGQRHPPLDRFRAEKSRLRLLSADFTELLTEKQLHVSPPVGVSVWAFQGVTPSFHPSDCQFYEAFQRLLSIRFFFASRLTFSVRNVSHGCHFRTPQED
jgi:hypothetical protein